MNLPESPLLTDLYQLTMAQAYFQHDMHSTAVFELFTRRLPRNRNFLVAAGLEQVLEYLRDFRFGANDLEQLAGLGLFTSAFLDYLSALRFTGSVHAMPEGTLLFADEPMLQVAAPVIEAQLVESRIINLVHYQTMVASKAARCRQVGGRARLIDFGMRRAHGAEAALYASRADFIAGFDATATVAAGLRFGVPIAGTMAHSYVEAHASEEQAFRHFLASRTAPSTLLIDTYDCERAAHGVAALHAEQQRGARFGPIDAVRIDSGDLLTLSQRVRAILDAAGAAALKIVASGDLDEYRIDELLRAGAPIDAFGVGTRLDASVDAPTLDMAYKLQEYDGLPRRKRSPGKATWPGRKQVDRECGADGRLWRDHLRLSDEPVTGQPMLQPVMQEGNLTGPVPALSEVRRYCERQLAQLPPGLRGLPGASPPYEVQVSEALRLLAIQLDAGTR
jgi:nicotinate phosphoribosyltransferase